MDKSELDKILGLHKKWMNGDPDGQRANLRSANLRSANLRSANLRNAGLRNADLSGADLSDANLRSANLSGADLSGADLSGANLRNANLRSANLRSANLSSANLRYADLRDADLRDANIDYSCFPLWCGGLSVHFDDKQIKQLLYHIVQNALYSKNTSDRIKAVLGQQDIIDLANEFHRANECGKLWGGRK